MRRDPYKRGYFHILNAFVLQHGLGIPSLRKSCIYTVHAFDTCDLLSGVIPLFPCSTTLLIFTPSPENIVAQNVKADGTKKKTKNSKGKNSKPLTYSDAIF